MKKLKTIDWYVIALILFGIGAVVLRTFALINDFNSLTKYFEDSITATVGNLLVTIGVVIFMSYILVGRKDQQLISKSDNAATFIPAGLVSVALLFIGVEGFKNLSSSAGEETLIRVLFILAPIFAVLSVVSFFISIFIEKRNIYKAAFSLSIVMFLAIYASLLFFNPNGHPTNSPNKIVDQMAFLLSASFFLFETRIFLGRAKWHLYVAFGLAASLLCMYSAIPSILTYIIDGYVVSASITESVLSLTLAIFITSKVCQTKTLTPDEECGIAQSISALAAFRAEEIEKARNLSHAREDNNVESEATQDASNYTFDIPYVDPTTDVDPDGADIDINKTQE